MGSRFSSYIGCDHNPTAMCSCSSGWIVVEHEEGQCEKVEWNLQGPIYTQGEAFAEGVRIILADRLHDAIYGDRQGDVLKEVWEYLRQARMIVNGEDDG
jgi:hypothetical protein